MNADKMETWGLGKLFMDEGFRAELEVPISILFMNETISESNFLWHDFKTEWKP